MPNVVRNSFRRFVVKVTHTDGVWIAECEELGLVTEADSFDALTERAWQIAPELAAENGLGTDAAGMHLLFQHEQSAPELLAL
ncbi:MAG: DUF1902 domain-containing protein [Proteobacteria bacterium]|nr:DUF1902 domain-containing protein [Pseudomonadota bacterium]